MIASPPIVIADWAMGLASAPIVTFACSRYEGHERPMHIKKSTMKIKRGWLPQIDAPVWLHRAGDTTMSCAVTASKPLRRATPRRPG